jgi:hypothetical protein
MCTVHCNMSYHYIAHPFDNAMINRHNYELLRCIKHGEKIVSLGISRYRSVADGYTNH